VIAPSAVAEPRQPAASTSLQGAEPASERAFRLVSLAALLLPLLVLGVLFAGALITALPRLGPSFLLGYPSRHAEAAGILPALVGSVVLIVLTAAMAVPLGVGAAVYLEEYARPSRVTALIELNIANLAGVPSIIYGLLGLEVFVHVLGLGRSVLAGAATLALLVLPTVIITSREALRTVPLSLREAAFALGADRWVTLRRVVLPTCLPGILTGLILSLARALGETAPLVTIGALTYVAALPTSPFSAFTALPIQTFNWISRPQAGFHVNAAAAIVVLLVLMLVLNGTAIWLRVRFEPRSP
jgi:phosphate transport system permease protein